LQDVAHLVVLGTQLVGGVLQASRAEVAVDLGDEWPGVLLERPQRLRRVAEVGDNNGGTRGYAVKDGERSSLDEVIEVRREDNAQAVRSHECGENVVTVVGCRPPAELSDDVCSDVGGRVGPLEGDGVLIDVSASGKAVGAVKVVLDQATSATVRRVDVLDIQTMSVAIQLVFESDGQLPGRRNARHGGGARSD
jgi:hypothetical protein